MQTPPTMTRNQKRLSRERHTLQFMIGIYCRGRHQRGKSICGVCQQLADYAMQRIIRCPFQNAKPTCAQCPVHCYNPTMRERVREVMRYAGPRMMLHHPILAILHALDKRHAHKTPPRPAL